MDCSSFSKYKTGLGASNVIGVDLKADTVVSIGIHAKCCSYTPKRFGQGNGSTSMKKSERLVGPVVYWHSGNQEFVADFCEFYPKMAHHCVDGQVIKLLHRYVT